MKESTVVRKLYLVIQGIVIGIVLGCLIAIMNNTSEIAAQLTRIGSCL